MVTVRSISAVIKVARERKYRDPVSFSQGLSVSGIRESRARAISILPSCRPGGLLPYLAAEQAATLSCFKPNLYSLSAGIPLLSGTPS